MNVISRLLLSTLVAASAITAAYAQEVLLPRAYESTNVGIVYDRELSFPLALHTNGFHLGFNVGRLKTYYKTAYWGMTLGHLKHPSEYKTSGRAGNVTGTSSGYVFGKRNSVVPVRIFKGWKRYYSGKDRRRGVAVGSSFELGATAALVKPYILEVLPVGSEIGSPPVFISYDDNPEGFRTPTRIGGPGGLRRGWSDVSVRPGLNAKAALHLDWGAFDEFMRAFEAGVMVDAFPGDLPILFPDGDNRPLFVNFYLAVHLGTRR